MEKRTARRVIITIVVMGKREIPRSTLKAILKQAELPQKDFLKHLR
jgi:predicted RNA binding protein YcfA (HicA-like mRNA interferase family)